MVGTCGSVDGVGYFVDPSHVLGRKESLQSPATFRFTSVGSSPKHAHHRRGGVLFFAGIAIISNVFPNKTVTWWTTAGFVGFALLSLLMVADYFLGHHQVSEEGLSYGRLTGRRGYLKWADLRRVKYAPTMKWFRLETQSGDVARISAMLIGLPEFGRLLLSHAPPQVIDAKTLLILQATADGNPPSVWS
jgi:hypothetical protein